MNNCAALAMRWERHLAGYATQTVRHTVFTRLTSSYSKPQRHYHNLEHVAAVLDRIEHLWPAAPLPLILAGWFHDVVYDPRRQDNEVQSAEYAEQEGKTLGLSATELTEMSRLILLTRSHEVASEDQAGGVLVDADLAILAAAPEAYDAYAVAIRREYSWVADKEYRAGRTAVLQRFLQRAQLFWSARLKREEQLARANLQRELSRLILSGQEKGV